MPVFTHTFTVAADAPTAFDYVSDLTTEREWNDTCTSVEPLTPGPVGPETRWRAKWQGGPALEARVYAYDRPRRVVLGSDGPLTVRSTWTFTPTASGTQVVSAFDVTPRGPMRVLFPLFASRFRRQSQRSWARLQQVLDARAASSPAAGG